MRRWAVLGAGAALIAGAVSPRAHGAAPLDLRGAPTQGGLVFARVPPGTRAWLEGKVLRVGEDGRFVFGFGRDHGPEAELDLEGPGFGRDTRRLSVARRVYDIQRIDGLPPRMVEPSEADLARIKADNAAIAAARARYLAEAHWDTDWVWPVTGPISGVYGSQRILNGQPRRPHYGVDIAMPTGTPVVAPAPGIVSLAVPDMYFTGGTLMLDHGHGVASIYAHLAALDVAPGRRVAKGERIAAVGATGRVTGAHLHWGLTWISVQVDPALLVPPMPRQPPAPG
jgi:murein DD-endopeptidase MepM/ murein hydrolase activator NlpD